MSNKRALTEKEKQVANNLKNIWLTKKKSLGITSQEKLAHEMDFKTQGSVTQYLNGIIPLGMEVGFKFAAVLKVLPGDINPDWAEYDLPFKSNKSLEPEKQTAIELIKELEPNQTKMKMIVDFIKMMKGDA